MSSDNEFWWGVGIEDTNIGWPIRGRGTGLDEYELTDHYTQWKADLELARGLGVSVMRYGLPWYRINPRPGEWDWEWADKVVAYATETLGLELIIDLVHYGTPAWLAGAFTDDAYPEAVAAYAGAVAARYAGRVRRFTPLNEPLVTASFTGARGIWPPYEQGDAGWARVVVNIAVGIQRTMRAIKAAQPEASIAHVEATLVWTTADPALQDHRAHLEARNFLPTDLVLGSVGTTHPLYNWLVELGISEQQLASLVRGAARPELIGLNYYPELSCRELVTFENSVVGIASDGGAAGLRKVIGEFHDRYRLPILISETGIEGEPEKLTKWLREAAATAAWLRRAAVPVVGLIWWPLFDFVDWSWGSGGAVVEEFYTRIDGRISPVVPPPVSDGLASYFRRMGLWQLAPARDQTLSRVRTAAADQFQQLARAPFTAALDLDHSQK